MIRPHPAATIDAVSKANPARRISITSPAVRAAVVSALCAFALHLAFPRTGAWWLIPFALAVLFRVWSALPPAAAALNGYLSGLVFFTLSFSWFGETAGALVGPLAFAIDLGPAIGEAFAFAFTALIASIAVRRAPALIVPPAIAATFVAGEWMRSSGVLGVPFGQLGLPLIDSPLRPIAAFIGGYGMTFVIALVAAYAAFVFRGTRALRIAAVSAFACAIVVTIGASLAWPARSLAAPTLRAAAIQGNIPQTVKSTLAARVLAVQRYTTMTEAVAAQHPAFIVWPETVILTDMSRDLVLRAQFGALAKRIGIPIFVGTITTDVAGQIYNTLVIFDAHGTPVSSVMKRQLVPFAEFLPAPASWRAIPAIDQIGKFMQGHGPQIEPLTGAGVLICWESMFGDVALDLVHAGAPYLIIATDDAWFGHSDGPAQHAQATTLRAVETGRWIVRSAATGISGIIAPDGTWRARSELETQTAIVGEIGAPVTTLYATIGPNVIGLTLLAFALIVVLVPWRKTR